MIELPKELGVKLEWLCLSLHESFIKRVFSAIEELIKSESKNKELDEELQARITNTIVMSLASGFVLNAVEINSTITKNSFDHCFAKFLDVMRFSADEMKKINQSTMQ